MYTIIISPSAKKELKLISKLYKEAIVEAIQEIKENPFVGKALTRELAGKYSYKIGVYRIIYIVSKQNKKIQILTAGHRSNVYE